MPASKMTGHDSNSAAPSPRRLATPPPPSDRGRLEVRHNVEGGDSRHSRTSVRGTDIGRSPLDAEAVDAALRREMSRSQREGTPGGSPHRKRQRINGDR